MKCSACLGVNGCARLIAVLWCVHSSILLKAALHSLKGLGKHSVAAPLLRQTLGQCLTCFPPFWGIFYNFSGDSLLPVMCLILSVPPSLWFFIYWKDLSLLPFVLVQLGLNTRKALSPIYCPAYTELYHLTGILPSTFRFCHGLLLPLSFSVTYKRMFFPLFLWVWIWG